MAFWMVSRNQNGTERENMHPPRKTPFHSRVERFNQTGIWKHWSGYLIAPQYQYCLLYTSPSPRDS